MHWHIRGRARPGSPVRIALMVAVALSAALLLPTSADGAELASVCSHDDLAVCGGSGREMVAHSLDAFGPRGQVGALRRVLSNSSVLSAALVNGHCCLVTVDRAARRVESPALAPSVVSAGTLINSTTCRYTATTFSFGQSAGDGVYAADSSLGAEQGSNATSGFFSGDTMSSAKADAGVQITFQPGGGASWNGTTAVVSFPWHIQGTLAADDQGALGRSGSAMAMVTLNLVNQDLGPRFSSVQAMTESVAAGQNAKQIHRAYQDNVTNPAQMTVPVADNTTQAAYIQSISQVHAQSVLFGNASAHADFATGNINGRTGPQAWLDYMDWHYIFPNPQEVIGSCG